MELGRVGERCRDFGSWDVVLAPNIGAFRRVRTPPISNPFEMRRQAGLNTLEGAQQPILQVR